MAFYTYEGELMLTGTRGSVLKDFFMGLPRGVNYHWHTLFSYAMKPTFLDLWVTSRCNARCLMCNIWKSRGQSDLSLNEIESIFFSPTLSKVRCITITGGEPFLRKDLLHIIRLISSKLKKIQEILICTNGLLTKVIVNQTNEALEILGNDIRLRVGISFDGIGEEHDNVRNIRGIHNYAVETVKGLQKIQDKRLCVQADVAVGLYNIDQIEDIFQYYSNIVNKIVFFPIVLSDRPFNNKENESTLSFDSTSKSKFANFLKFLIQEESPSPISYFYSRLINFFETGKRNFPCTGGYRFMHIDSEGNVNSCSFIPQEVSYGNIRDKSLEQIWFSKEMNLLRKKLKESIICEKCPSHCDLFSLVREEFFDFMIFLMSHPRLLIKMLRRYFH